MATAVGSVGLGASLAGGLMSAFGAYQTGQANSKMYAYQAKVADYNSKIDLQNADYATVKGETEAADYGMKAAQTEGQIKATQGASGLDVNSGSNKAVQASEKTVATIDTNQIRANAAKTAYDFGVQSTQDVAQAGLYSMASKNASTAGDIGAAASLLGTAGSVSSKWLAGNQSGMFGGGGGLGGSVNVSGVWNPISGVG